jgi:cystathionine beta-lyase
MVDFDRVVDRLHSDSNKWQKYGPDVIPLWVADMDFPAPEPVVAALRRRVEHAVFGYLHEGTALADAFVPWARARYAWDVQPAWLSQLPGVIAAFNVAARAVVPPGQGLLIQVPVYPPILRCADVLGLRSDRHELTREADGRYTIDLAAFERAIRPDTRAFLLCNPHNPVGRVWRRDELERMAEICLRHGLWIIADEIHCDLRFDGRPHVPVASLAPEVAARTITLMAPSKTFNLAGLKTSVTIIPDAAMRERYTAAKGDLVRAVNTFGHVAAVAAYRDGGPWLDALVPYLQANRDATVDYVRREMPGIEVAPPEGTYLAWLDCRKTPIPKGDPYTFFLERAHVALNDGATFSPAGEGFARLNFACPRSQLAAGLDRMRDAFRAL